ncbi:uncharacterized [Tachysurus ichikawai]
MWRYGPQYQCQSLSWKRTRGPLGLWDLYGEVVTISRPAAFLLTVRDELIKRYTTCTDIHTDAQHTDLITAIL